MKLLSRWLEKRREAKQKRQAVKDLDNALEVMRGARLRILMDSGPGYRQSLNITEYLYQNRHIEGMM